MSHNPEMSDIGSPLDIYNLQDNTHHVPFENFSIQWLQKKEIYSSMKVLHLSNCPCLNETLNIILQNDILKSMMSCSHMFIIKFEVSSYSVLEEEKQKTTKLIQYLRPLIVQIETKNLSKIFFEDVNFNLIENTETNSTETHLFEHLKTKLIKDYKTLDIIFIAEFGLPLDVRIHKLIHEPSFEKLVLEIDASMKSKKLDNFRAVMNFSITNRNILDLKRETSRLADIKNVDLLALAIENGNVEVVKFLTRFNCDLISNIEFAWSNEQYECLSVLLNTDSLFPRGFNNNYINSMPDCLKKTLIERENFHRDVAQSNLKSIENFIKDHPNMRYAYNQKNESALKTALIFKQMEAYTLLKARGFSCGEDINLTEALEKLDDNQKALVRDANDQALENDKNNDLIRKLCSMSKLPKHDSERFPEAYGDIREMFENLNCIPEISTILKTVALSKNLLIIFDFKHKSIKHHNPTKPENTRGMVFENKVYIGAKYDDSVPFGRHGTLAHELTHYAMIQIYDNMALPYEKKCESDFIKVFEKCQNKFYTDKENDEMLLTCVFKDYDESAEHIELIVRPPHLLALYQNDGEKILNLREIYSDLFEYFTNKVLKDCEDRLLKEKKRLKLKRKNKNVGKKLPKKLKLENGIEVLRDISDYSANLITHSYFKRIGREKYLTIDFNLLLNRPIHLDQQKFYIIHFDKCPTLEESVAVMSQSDFINIFADSKLFILVLNIAENTSSKESEHIQKISGGFRKPVILQINHKNKKSVYYKECNKKFKKLVLPKKNRIEKAFPMTDCLDFETLCSFLHCDANYGRINYNLIETEIAMEKSIAGFRLIDWAVKSNNMLCVMFLHLFDPDLVSLNSNLSRVLEVAAESGTQQSFEMLLNVGHDGFIDPLKKQALNLDSMSYENLLMIAVKYKKLEIVKFLLCHDLNVNHLNALGLTASDIAWTNESFDVLIELLKNDAPFPRNFDESQVRHVHQFKMLISDRQEFHNAIMYNRLDKIERFVQNERLKFVYNKDNQSALKTALLSENFEIYSFLRSKGFSSGTDIQHDVLFQCLCNSDKKKLWKCNLKYFHVSNNKHIMDLVSKSRLAFGNNQNNFHMIRKLFEKLDAVEKISDILKIVASSNKIDIVFDFNNSSIEEMDPRGSEYTHGRVYFHSGHMFISAKQNSDDMVLGTLAHEFTHYALQLVYKNSFLPFIRRDLSREHEFMNIVRTYDEERYRNRNTIIANALNPAPIETKMTELIARVPHLLALHSNETEVLATISEEFNLLFEFFHNQTVPDLRREVNLIKPKFEIREINSNFGLYADAIQLSELSTETYRTIDISSNVFIESIYPDFVLETIIKQLQFEEDVVEINSNNIFAKLSVLKKNLKLLDSAIESEVKPRLFIIDDFEANDNDHGTVSELLDQAFHYLKIVFIARNENSPFRRYFKSSVQVDFQWDDLNEKTKCKFLESKIKFQDKEISLEELLVDESPLHKLPLEMIKNWSNQGVQNFSSSLPSTHQEFIDRTFQLYGAEETKTYKTKDIYEILLKKKSIMISGMRGMGNSTLAVKIARELKSNNPLSWIAFVDLKQSTKVFQDFTNRQNNSINPNYFFYEVLKLKSHFDHKLFQHFYENRKLIFIIDGFDEIEENYRQVFLMILEKIQISENLMVITSNYEKLELRLASVTFRLMRFSENDQINFLTNYWQEKNDKKDMKPKVVEFLNKLRLILDEEIDSFFIPINLTILGEVFREHNVSALGNSFMMYQLLMNVLLQIWNSDFTLLADADKKCSESQEIIENLLKNIHKLSLEQIFDASELSNLNWSYISEVRNPEIMARVSRVREFAEYFVADFVLNNIFKTVVDEAIVMLFVKSLVNENLKGVRTFMNHGFLHFQKKKNVEVLSKHFEKLALKNTEAKGDIKFSLNRIAEENQKNLINFVLKNPNFDFKLKATLAMKVFDELGIDLYCQT